MSQIVHSIIFIFISLLVYWILPKRWRSTYLFAASCYFMALFSIPFMVFFVLNAGLVYISGNYISKGGKNRSLLLKLTLLWLIGSLCVFKYAHLVLNSVFKIGSLISIMPDTTFSKLVLPLGLSYIIFRLIHYIVERYRQNLPEHTFWDLGLYVFFFPTFIAGPVDRFQRFHPQTAEQKSFDISDINYGLFRIISGTIKKFIIGDSLGPLVMPILSNPQESSAMILVLATYGLAIWIYMDFSGYTDIALGVARLFGYRIMENFNWPYFKNNIAMFWRNWHISVYSFIRDYFFFPLFGHRATQLKIYAGIFITMIVFMLWHEASLPWLALGIYHGSGLVIWQLLQELKSKHIRLRKVIDNRYLNPLSVFLTFSFVSFGFLMFTFDISTFLAIVGKMLTI